MSTFHLHYYPLTGRKNLRIMTNISQRIGTEKRHYPATHHMMKDGISKHNFTSKRSFTSVFSTCDWEEQKKTTEVLWFTCTSFRWENWNRGTDLTLTICWGIPSTLIEKGLANCPAQIWNCDETGFDLQGRAGTVIGPSTRKHAPYRVLSGSREHITMLPCFNACGQWMPPYFIFPGKRVPVTFNPLKGGVEGSIFSMTETGYMDTQTFYMWFANHFIPNLPPARPVVLLIDSHDSHLDLETFQLAQKNGICLYALLKKRDSPRSTCWCWSLRTHEEELV